MLVPIGVLLKSARKLIRYRQTSKKISERINELEAEDARPLLSAFSGVQRYEAAHRLLDAALIQRLRTALDAERPDIIEQYLTRSNEEYVMARENLAAVPATRADIAALGLALKELTLTFDGELGMFREHSAAELTAITERAEAQLIASSAAAFAEISKRIDEVVTSDTEARERIVALLESHRDNAATALECVRAEMAAEFEARSAWLADAHADHKRAVSESFARVEARLTGTEGALAAQHDEVSASLVCVDSRLANSEAALSSHRHEVSASLVHVDERLTQSEAALLLHRDEVSGSFNRIYRRLADNETSLTVHRTEVAGDLARISAANRSATVRLQLLMGASFMVTVLALVMAWHK